MCASLLLASRLALSSHTRRVSAALSTRSRADGCARLADTICGTLESGTQGGVPASNLACRGTGRKRTMYARVTNIRFPPDMKAEVSRVVQGLAPILRWQRGFESLQVLTDPSTGGGSIVTRWETEADAETSEATTAYIGQMSMMSSFLHEPLVPNTYQVSVKT